MEGCVRDCNGNIYWLQENRESRTYICYQNIKQGHMRIRKKQSNSNILSHVVMIDRGAIIIKAKYIDEGSEHQASFKW